MQQGYLTALFTCPQPLDLEEDISTLGSKEVVIERRVLFRLDLPNHKSIGVKAKPNRSIRDVFKPILNKYGHRIDSCGVQLVSSDSCGVQLVSSDSCGVQLVSSDSCGVQLVSSDSCGVQLVSSELWGTAGE